MAVQPTATDAANTRTTNGEQDSMMPRHRSLPPKSSSIVPNRALFEALITRQEPVAAQANETRSLPQAIIRKNHLPSTIQRQRSRKSSSPETPNSRAFVHQDFVSLLRMFGTIATFNGTGGIYLYNTTFDPPSHFDCRSSEVVPRSRRSLSLQQAKPHSPTPLPPSVKICCWSCQ